MWDGMAVSGVRHGAVVTAYFPGQPLIDLVALLEQECEQVVIVDNTPGWGGFCSALASERVVVLQQGENRGLGSALNIGVRALRDVGIEAATLWDQDSLPAPGYMSRLAESTTGHASWPYVISGGCHGTSAPYISGDDSELEPVIRLITSGMFLPIATYNKVGPFREEFFVDMIDTEYSLRARAAGVRLLRAPGLVINHHLGDAAKSAHALGFRTRTTGHPVWRQYWIARNTAILLHEFRTVDPKAIRSIRHDTFRWYARAIVGGPSRVSTALALVKGLHDGRTRTVDLRYGPPVTSVKERR